MEFYTKPSWRMSSCPAKQRTNNSTIPPIASVLMVVVALVVVLVKSPAVEAVIEVEGGQWSPLCENIDRRLPCSVPDISTTVSTGSSFGHFIGEHTAEAIKSFYASPDGCPVFEELYSVSGSFRRFIDEYMTVHEEAYPTEHEEVVGMAEGAGIAASSVFIQNSCSEMYLLFGEDVKVVAEPTPVNPPPIYAPYLFSDTSVGTDDATIVDNVTDISSPSQHSRRKDHCSDIGLIYNSKDEDNDCDATNYHIVQGHNEDWWSGVADKMSVVHTPEWMGYAYPGQLPGTSFFTTAKGLAISMNSMYPLQPGYSHKSTSNGKGISYVFAYPLRKAISSNTISEVISTLSQHPVYSGYSLNVMSACDKSLTNVEGYGDRLGVQSRHGSSSSGGSNMCSSDSSGVVGHFNSYINLAVDESQSGTSGSRRECQQNTDFSSVADVRAFLGDLECPVFFTDLNGEHGSETIATWITDPQTRTISMYRLPVVCDVTYSRCYDIGHAADAPSVEYGWDFECPGV